MTEPTCIRCQSPLTLDGGQLTYCSVCGAPQIFLSEELQQQAARDAGAYGERTAEGAVAHVAPVGVVPPNRGPGTNPWSLAVRYALLSSGIAFALSLGGSLLDPLLALDWLWIVSAPILTVGFYRSRAQTATLSAAFAARLGLLTGLLIFVSVAVILTLTLVLARASHHGAGLDTQLAAAFAQVRTATQAQYGDAAAPVIRLLGVPEFRIGFLLWMVAITGTLYLFLATVTAGLAGLLLSRRRAA